MMHMLAHNCLARRLGPLLLLALIGCAAPPAAAPTATAPTATAPAKPAAAGAPQGAASGAPAASAAPAPTAPPAREPWTYGQVSVFAAYWPHFVGIHRGFFDQEALDIERIVSPSAAQLIAAVASGSVNSGTIAPDGTVRAIEQGAPLAMVGAEQDTVIYSLMTANNVRGYADLRGKPVGAAEARGAATLILRKMLSSGGLRDDDYDLVIVGGTRERYTGIKTGVISAGLLSQPQDFQLADEGFPRLALSTDVLKPYLFGPVTMNRDWVRQNDARALRYMRALLRGARWLNDPANKAEAVRILQEETQTEERYARLTYELYIEDQRVMPPDLALDPRSLEAVLDLMAENGELPTPRPPASKYVDNSLRERALAQR